MISPFELYIPENLTFQDYLAICQTARVWADGYDLKSLPHLVSTLAPQVSIDYSDVVAAWGIKTYTGPEFAELWTSSEHLGNRALATQHLLGQPYFNYVGPSRGGSTKDDRPPSSTKTEEVVEVVVTWQILASHGRRVPLPVPPSEDGSSTDSTGKSKLQYGGPMSPVKETSDHRSFMQHRFIKIDSAHESGSKVWKIASIKPTPVYGTGDFAKVRRHEDEE